jgi:hypothetical protein
VAHPWSRWPAGVFSPFGYPFEEMGHVLLVSYHLSPSFISSQTRIRM